MNQSSKAIVSSSNSDVNTSSNTPQPGRRNQRPDSGRRGRDPLEYSHRYDSLRRFAEALALKYDQIRTRQAYYRELRLISEFGGQDPALLNEDQVREFFLRAKQVKNWAPKTVRQAVAAARLFFVDLLGH